MKTMRIFETRSLILILGAVLGVNVGFAAPTFAAYAIVNPDGKVTYISPISPFGAALYPHAINNSGQVVGSMEVGTHRRDHRLHAFITGPNGQGVTDLGTLGGHSSGAEGINESGQVVGYSVSEGGRHAFITGPNGQGMTDLGTLGGLVSVASGINESGQVVGVSWLGNSGNPTHAFITGLNGQRMTDLGTLGGDDSRATGINDSGQVVGHSQTADGSWHAFITGANGKGMTDLRALGTESSAEAINDSGQVAGSIGIEGDSHASITGPNGQGITDLGTLGGSWSGAIGINDSGQVVGHSYTADGSLHNFITGPDGVGMIDINSYLPDGLYMLSVHGINNLGQVIGTVNTIPPIPEPASYALMLAGLGLVAFMAQRKNAAGNIV